MAAHIRPFKPSDSEQTAHICRSTLPPTLKVSEPARRIAPYVWALQFTTLSPQNCFVLDDGTGTAVGYVIGCADVFAFADAYPRYIEEVLGREPGRTDVPVPKQLVTHAPWFVPGTEVSDAQPGQPLGVINEEALAQQAYNPRWLLLEGAEGRAEMVRRYRATMHIDLLEPFQGRGWGRRLIEVFVESVREAVRAGRGDAGEGIAIGVAGENEKVVPFYEKVGFRVYEDGANDGNVWMVRDL